MRKAAFMAALVLATGIAAQPPYSDSLMVVCKCELVLDVPLGCARIYAVAVKADTTYTVHYCRSKWETWRAWMIRKKIDALGSGQPDSLRFIDSVPIPVTPKTTTGPTFQWPF